MKKNYLITLMAFFFFKVLTINAQIENYYTFSQSTAEYTPLVGADETVLSPFTRYNNFIPFDFEYAGKLTRFLLFHANGTLNAGGSVLPQPNDLSDIGQQSFGANSIIAPLWDGSFPSLRVLSGNTTGKRKTLVQGTAPNRTFTVEWENILWASTGSEVSFRVIFEETTNNITFLYGPNLSEEIQSASIGINTEFGSEISFLSVTPTATATVSSTTSNNSISPADYPGEGISYTFTYTPPSCKIPSELSADEDLLTPSTAEISWTNGDSEASWDLLLTNEDTDVTTTITANTNPFTIEDLDENTLYSVSIRANCGTNDISDYSPFTLFTTPQICPQPTNLTANDISFTSADFTWSAGDQETEWEVIILEADQPEPTAGTMVSTTNYSASDLIKDTDYTLYVRSNCGAEDGFSIWSTRNFTTLATCLAPTGVVISNETCNSFDLDWTSNNSETSWEILLQRVGTTEEITIITDEKPTTINNLIPNGFYRVFVKSICAEDDKSRFSIRDFARTIDDDVDPIAITKNITVELDETGRATIIGDDVNNGSTDDCGIRSTSVFPNSFTCNDLGENTVNFTITDNSFNTSTASAIVTVVDTTNPVANCVGSLTVQLNIFGQANVFLSQINNLSTDNCSVSTSLDKTSFTGDDLGENTITLTVTDTSGNSDTCTTIVTVEDEVLPVANCVGDFAIQLDQTGNATITTDDINDSSADNAAIQSVTIDKTNFSAEDLGENTITLTVTDTSGNSDTCTTIVTVEPAANISLLEDYVTNLNNPRGLAFDSNDILFIGDDSGKVFRATDIETSTEYASTGFGTNNIAFDNSGNLYTTDDFLSQIFQINTNGEDAVYLNFSNDVSNPWGITFDTEGNLYYSNQFGGDIIKVTPNLVITEYATGFFRPEGIAFDSNGNLFVADGSDRKLIKIAPDGTQTTLLSNIPGIRAIAIDSEDNIYFNQSVGFSNPQITVIKLDQSDNSQTEILSSGLTAVNELEFNTSGDLFIAQNDRVSVLRNVAEPEETLSNEDFTVNTITFYPNPVTDNLYFAEAVDAITIYEMSGKEVIEINNSGKEFNLSQLPTGVYIINIKKDDYSVVKKLIKN